MICCLCGFKHDYLICPICSGKGLINEMHIIRERNKNKLCTGSDTQGSAGVREMVQRQVEHPTKTKDDNYQKLQQKSNY